MSPAPMVITTSPARAALARAPESAPRAPCHATEPPATEQQLASIRKLCTALGKPEPEPVATFAEAKQVIMQLSSEYQRARKAS